MQEDCARRKAIASGSADLLVVRLDTGREGCVDDGADVGFVDAHAEGDRGYDDFKFAAEEVALDSLTRARIETGMICSRASA
jgi:hypothetical protein